MKKRKIALTATLSAVALSFTACGMYGSEPVSSIPPETELSVSEDTSELTQNIPEVDNPDDNS